MRGAGLIDTVMQAGRVQCAELIAITIRKGVLTEESPGDLHLEPTVVVENKATWATIPYRTSYLGDFRTRVSTARGYNRGDVGEVAAQEVSSCTIELSDEGFPWSLWSDTVEIVNMPLQTLARLGLLDGAVLEVQSVWSASMAPLSPVLPSDAQTVTDFRGFVQRATPRDGGVALEVSAFPGHMAGQSMPRHLVTPYCRHQFMSANCKIRPTSSRGYVNAYVQASEANSRTKFRCMGFDLPFDQNPLNRTPAMFRGGRIEVRRGMNYGMVGVIENFVHVGTETQGGITLRVADITLSAPGFPWALEVDDVVRYWPGCAKTKTACNAFGSPDYLYPGASFGGFPNMPPPETV